MNMVSFLTATGTGTASSCPIFANFFVLSSQEHNFTEEFYAPPVVMVTGNHLYDSKNVHSTKPENNVLNTWVEVNCPYSDMQNKLFQFKRKSTLGMKLFFFSLI